jgi:uncharacterized protein YecT (DUF1311 family)
MVAGQAQANNDGASSIHYSARYLSCSDRAEGSYTHIMACESEEQVLQEKRLNQAYIKIMRRLTAKQKSILRDSERRWIIERDKKCSLVAGVMGTSDLVDRMLCRLDETIARAIWLQHYRVQ